MKSIHEERLLPWDLISLYSSSPLCPNALPLPSLLNILLKCPWSSHVPSPGKPSWPSLHVVESMVLSHALCPYLLHLLWGAVLLSTTLQTIISWGVRGWGEEGGAEWQWSRKSPSGKDGQRILELFWWWALGRNAGKGAGSCVLQANCWWIGGGWQQRESRNKGKEETPSLQVSLEIQRGALGFPPYMQGSWELVLHVLKDGRLGYLDTWHLG